MAPPWLGLVLALATTALSGPAKMRDLMRSAQVLMEPRAAGSETEALRCFEVTSPVLAPEGLQVGHETVGRPPSIYRSCSLRLVDHVFANSYGKPFVGESSRVCQVGSVDAPRQGPTRPRTASSAESSST